MTHQLIYHFDLPPSSTANIKDLLGGKGAALMEMSKLGLKVPAGFTATTDLCQIYYQNNQQLPESFITELETAIEQLEHKTGKSLGGEQPLLLSIRSGAPISMPGMMDTILNLGLNDSTVKKLAKQTNKPEFAYDSYRRLIQMYGATVYEIPIHYFESLYEELHGQVSAQELIAAFKKLFHQHSGEEFPQSLRIQILQSIEAVLKSWFSNRAISYREIHNINSSLGTAVNIQEMVFGNLNNESATGVVFTRSPVNGSAQLYGEYLPCAQGEDIVAGTHTPLPIFATDDDHSMHKQMPELYKQLQNICSKLEQHYSDMQDIEFTIEDGTLYVLQTRSGKRNIHAAIQIATDMVAEDVISKEQALLHIDPSSINQLLHTQIDYSTASNDIVGHGLPASPGAATGIIALSAAKAEEMSLHHKVILVRHDTSPEDIRGMNASSGILTARGGMTSHAAVVARGMGKPCICGASSVDINEHQKTVSIGNITLNEGDIITIDGSKGNLIVGSVNLKTPELPTTFYQLMEWADQYKDMQVKANAETISDIKAALKFGAEGIGLCRTEHMFFEKEKLDLIHRVIVAETAKQRQEALDALKPLHQSDFEDIFRIMEGKAVNIRLLDPPLHEFLPHKNKEIKALAESLNLTVAQVENRIEQLEESNPMLGHRGCRLGITHPEIYIMQIEAILDAAAVIMQNNGSVKLEIMLPLISTVKELDILTNMIHKQRKLHETKHQLKFDLVIGTMIETPRSCIISSELAEKVDYFSFGTNDLTQTTLGISRDDMSGFAPEYLKQDIWHQDPFVNIDIKGVGRLMEYCTHTKQMKPNFILGICGEHGGDPESIEFFDRIGLDYVSCSPYRILIARLSAAISAIKRKNQNL